jgi:hypothetical protein
MVALMIIYIVVAMNTYAVTVMNTYIVTTELERKLAEMDLTIKQGKKIIIHSFTLILSSLCIVIPS